MSKLFTQLKNHPFLFVIVLFYALAMTLWISHIFTSHMILAAVVSFLLSIIIGSLVYYATDDFKMAIPIALSALPGSFIFALITDRVLEAIWRISIFHTESDMLDLMDITLGAIVGVAMMFVISYTINKTWGIK